MVRHLLAIEQGSERSASFVFGLDAEVRGRASCAVPASSPRPDWLEQDPEAIWDSVARSVSAALEAARIDACEIGAIGIANQRETTVVWDRRTGTPIHAAIGGACRRTAAACRRLVDEGLGPSVRELTGLPIEVFFSGSKIAWILDAVDGARRRAADRDLSFGTIDAFLVHRLTGGVAHVTDPSNASRTLLMDLRRLSWDEELLSLLRVPAPVLPKIVPSAGRIGTTKGLSFLPDGIPIGAIIGDRQAALFGQGCFTAGEAICMYGPRGFALLNLGDRPVVPGLTTTVAWHHDDVTTYALEMNSRTPEAAAPEDLAVHAHGVLTMMSRLARRPLAALSIAGDAADDWLAQHQADVLGVAVRRSPDLGATARGAAMLAALGAGLVDIATLRARRDGDRTFDPTISPSARNALLARSREAAKSARPPVATSPAGSSDDCTADRDVVASDDVCVVTTRSAQLAAGPTARHPRRIAPRGRR